jgi:tripartite-type tricarboxylate transporter receptor subunit TctC
MRAIVSLFALLLSSACWSQAFPSKPITMVVGFEPGGGTDTVARVVAKFLGDNIGQQVLVENRAGARRNVEV